jgi:hypothetical protein
LDGAATREKGVVHAASTALTDEEWNALYPDRALVAAVGAPEVEALRVRARAIFENVHDDDIDFEVSDDFSMIGYTSSMPQRHLALVDDSPREIAIAEERALDALEALARFATSDSSESRAHASTSLSRILMATLETKDRTLNGLADARSESRWSECEVALRRVRAKSVIAPRAWWPTAADVWPFAGLLLTAAAGWLIISGHVLAAATLVVVRLFVSAAFPPPYSIGLENSDRMRTSFKACVAGHATDMIAFTSIALALAAKGRTGWAATVAMLAILMLAGTLYRLAAMQAAVYVRRKTFERAFRNGSLLAVLLAASAYQGTIPTAGVPVLALAAVMPAIWGLIEIALVLDRERKNRERRRHLEPAERVADEQVEVRAALGEILVTPEQAA